MVGLRFVSMPDDLRSYFLLIGVDPEGRSAESIRQHWRAIRDDHRERAKSRIQHDLDDVSRGSRD